MICPNCKTDNAASGKFCTNCGTPLQAGVQPAPQSSPSSPASQNIFSDKEVEILLNINRSIVQSGGKQQAVSQDDIDKLFD